jgi:hypothetical protein
MLEIDYLVRYVPPFNATEPAVAEQSRLVCAREHIDIVILAAQGAEDRTRACPVVQGTVTAGPHERSRWFPWPRVASGGCLESSQDLPGC